MAENFARKGIKIQDVSAGFVELENVSQLQSSLKEAGELQDPMILFHDMWEVAQDPKSNFTPPWLGGLLKKEPEK